MRVHLNSLAHSAIVSDLERYEESASALAYELQRLREEIHGLEFSELTKIVGRIQHLVEHCRASYALLIWHLQHIEFRKEPS